MADPKLSRAELFDVARASVATVDSQARLAADRLLNQDGPTALAYLREIQLRVERAIELVEAATAAGEEDR